MNCIRSRGLKFWSFLVLIAMAVPLGAQTPAATFEELGARRQLKEKESIEVTEPGGTKYKARIEAITGNSW